MVGGVLNAFNALPQGVQNALVAVVTVVREAALAVYEWFSYLNPFARHSPSLVDNVVAGTEAVKAAYGSLPGSVGGSINAAYAEVKRFGQLTRELGVSAAAMEQADTRKTLRKAGAGEALGSYNNLIGILNKLTPQMDRLEGKVNAQQRVVDLWQKKLDAVNWRLDQQQYILDGLNSNLEHYQGLLDNAQQRLSDYANAPLEGMRAMEDQIFANQMAQTKLRYEMMKIEDTYGSFDGLKDRLNAINGAQELLRGTREGLRLKGAGSDILAPYDAQIAALEAQKGAYGEAAGEMNKMETELARLQREAENLDLTKAMKFDELQYQIARAADTMQEMPFEEIMAGIQGAKNDIERYTPAVNAATEAVERQQKVVDRLTGARDKLQQRMDAEQRVLDRVTEKYNQVKDAVDAINSAISDVVSNAEKMNEKLGAGADDALKKGAAAAGSEYVSPGLANFRAAGNADFPDPGGAGIPPRTDWSSQEDAINAFTDDLAMDTASIFGDLNPFKGLTDKAKQAWDWVKQETIRFGNWLGGFFGDVFAGVDFGGGDAWGKFVDVLVSIGEFTTEVLRDIAKIFKWAWDLLGPDVIKMGQGIWNGLKVIWDEIGPELAQFAELWGPLGEAIKNIWAVLKPILAVIGGAVLAILKVIFAVVAETIGPIFETLGHILANVIQIVRGVIKVVVGLFALDFGMVFGGLEDIFQGIFGGIWDIIAGAVRIIWNLVEGLVKGIWGFFTWLWDVLVGHSVVPDIIDGILFWFNKLVALAQWIWTKVLVPIWNVFKRAFPLIAAVLTAWWAGVKMAWAALTTAATWIWDNVLQPIWDKFKELWPKIAPLLALWWEGVKIQWAALSKAATWLWENVLEPVWEAVKFLWTKYVQPEIAEWWPRIKRAWNALKKVAIWLWTNVLKPAWDRVKELWNKVKPELDKWWSRIQGAWNKLKALGTWLWNNVLKPVWDRIKELWDKVKPELDKWRERIESAWNKLKALGTWIKQNVMDPIFDAFREGWNRIRDWLQGARDLLADPMQAAVRGVVSAINWIIRGLNKLDDLPGISISISEIVLPEGFESGGAMPARRASRGMVTSGARAIIGEGKPNYPEYVIPTDPTYRSRATSLLAAAGQKIGAQVIPMHEDGGIMGFLGDIGGGIVDLGSAGWNAVQDAGRNAISAGMAPFFAGATAAANLIDWSVAEDGAKGAIELAKKWVAGVDEKYEDQYQAQKKKNAIPKGGNPFNYQGQGPWSPMPFRGVTMNRAQVAAVIAAERTLGWSFNISQGSYSSSVSASGDTHSGGGAFDATPATSAGVAALRHQGQAAWLRTPAQGPWGYHIHSLHIGDPTMHPSAKSQVADFLNGGDGLAAHGAIVRARMGGTKVTVGEGGQDEAILPLPSNWRAGGFRPSWGAGNDGAGATVIINGNLEFPNITDGNDADEFIENLKVLAKD